MAPDRPGPPCAALSDQEAVYVGVPDANGYPADCPVVPPHLTGPLALRLPAPGEGQPNAPLAGPAGRDPRAYAGTAPTQEPGTAARPPQAPQEALASAPAPGPQAAVDPPHDQSQPLSPSPGGPLFAPVRDATAIAEGIRRLPRPPSTGGAHGLSPAPPLP